MREQTEISAIGESVPPKSLDAALEHIEAGGTLTITTYTHHTVISQATVARFAKAGAWLLKEDGNGYRIRRGKGSDYLFPGHLKFRS